MNTLSMPKKIKGERVILKKLVLEYAEEIFKCVDSDREHLGHFLHWVDKTNTLQDEINFIKTSDMHLGKPHRPYCIFYQDKFVGCIGALNIVLENNACEIGYWLCSGSQGKGLVSDAICAFENELSLQGFKRIALEIEPLNTRSIEVAKRNGYKYESTVNKNMYGKDLEFMVFVKTF